MAFINEYVYSDFNEYNLDWLIKTCKDLVTQWAAVQQEWSDTEAAWEDMKNYINNYFDNLDVSQEISDKINAMVADGTFQAIVAPFFAEAIGEVPDIVSDWIADNLLQETGYVIDKSLTTANAAADAKSTGDNLRDTYENFTEDGDYIRTINIDANKIWDTGSGNKASLSGWYSSSELIPISGKYFYVSEIGYPINITMYDENKTYITYVIARDLATYTGLSFQGISANCKYIGLTVNTSGTPITEIKIRAIKQKPVYQYPFVHGDGCFVLQNHFISNNSISSNNDYDVIIFPVEAGEEWYANTRFAENFNCRRFPGASTGAATYTNIDYLSRIYTIPADSKQCLCNIRHAEYHGSSSQYSDVFMKVTQPRKILAIGDSLTFLDGTTGGHDGATRFLGWQKILEASGYKIESKGYNGATYATGVTGVDSIYTKVVTDGLTVSGYDTIILFGGTNDCLYSVPIGTRKDDYNDHSFDSSTFNGALSGIIYYIRQNNPTCKIILCSCIKSEASQRTFTHAKAYVDEIEYNSEFWSCFYNDMFRTFNVSPYTDSFNEFYYDNTHPNKEGMRRIGELMLKAVEDC